MPYKEGYGMKSKPKDFGLNKAKDLGLDVKIDSKTKIMKKGSK